MDIQDLNSYEIWKIRQELMKKKAPDWAIDKAIAEQMMQNYANELHREQRMFMKRNPIEAEETNDKIL